MYLSRLHRLSSALLACAALSLPAACKTEGPSTPPTVDGPKVDASAEYDALVTDFFDSRASTESEAAVPGYFERFPVAATALGVHVYDDRWPQLDADGRAANVAWAEALLARIDALAGADLDADQRVDLQILRDQLASLVFSERVENTWSTNPLAWSYLVGGGLDTLINRDFAPVEQRARSVAARLEALPDLLVQAASSMSDPAAIKKPQALVAKQQLEGVRSLIRLEIPEKLAGAEAATLERIEIASRTALKALDIYEDQVLGESQLAFANGAWRLGKEAFETKLGYTLGQTVDAKALYERAKTTHAEVRARMESLAFELYEPLFGRRPPGGADDLGRARIVREVLEELAKIHPAPAQLRDACEANLDTIESFVKGQGIVPLDPNEPLEVIWTPPHQQGVAIAGLDPAPPFDTGKQLQSFYLVQPIPKDWSAEVTESFLREYNHFMLEILSIHEAIPGHFVQLYYGKRDDSRVRKAFANGPFVEGWAVYTEKVMVDQGYAGVDPTVGPDGKRERPAEVSERLWKLAADPELRAKAIALHGAKFFLRTVTNAILDYEIHAGQLDEAGALKLMVQRAYQQEGEARGKWVRAQVTSTQLSTYFVGASWWFDLRAEAEQAPDFDLSAWHAAALSHGAPPVPALRELMAK